MPRRIVARGRRRRGHRQQGSRHVQDPAAHATASSHRASLARSAAAATSPRQKASMAAATAIWMRSPGRARASSTSDSRQPSCESARSQTPSKRECAPPMLLRIESAYCVMPRRCAELRASASSSRMRPRPLHSWRPVSAYLEQAADALVTQALSSRARTHSRCSDVLQAAEVAERHCAAAHGSERRAPVGHAKFRSDCDRPLRWPRSSHSRRRSRDVSASSRAASVSTRTSMSSGTVRRPRRSSSASSLSSRSHRALVETSSRCHGERPPASDLARSRGPRTASSRARWHPPSRRSPVSVKSRPAHEQRAGRSG